MCDSGVYEIWMLVRWWMLGEALCGWMDGSLVQTQEFDWFLGVVQMCKL